MTTQATTVTQENHAANRAENETSEYFDRHTYGVGYANRIRYVKTRRMREGVWAMTIGSFSGEKDDVQYTYYDVTIVGRQAIARAQALQSVVDEGAKVIIGFTISDEYPHFFLTREAQEQDVIAVRDIHKFIRLNNKGRLLNIKWANVNGQPFDFGDEVDERELDTDEVEAEAMDASGETTAENGSDEQYKPQPARSQRRTNHQAA